MDLAAQIAEKANECCNRSDGWEEDVAAEARALIAQSMAERQVRALESIAASLAKLAHAGNPIDLEPGPITSYNTVDRCPRCGHACQRDGILAECLPAYLCTNPECSTKWVPGLFESSAPVRISR